MGGRSCEGRYKDCMIIQSRVKETSPSLAFVRFPVDGDEIHNPMTPPHADQSPPVSYS